MSTEENTAIARRAYEILIQALRTGNMAALDALDEIIAADAVDHNPAPGQGPGLAGIKQAFAEFHAAFPDLHFELEDVVAEGDKAACRVTIRGTHRGSFRGVPASGRRINLTGIDLLRFVDGKIVERWGEFDEADLLKQIGVTPPAAQPGE